MSVSSINSSDLLSSILSATYSTDTKDTSGTSQSSGSDNTQISSIGELMNAVSQMSEDDQSSIKSFLDDLKTAVEDGTFDADALASSAPDVLQSLAEENGMSVSELIQELADEAENAPQPPADMSGSSKYQSSAFTGYVYSIEA